MIRVLDDLRHCGPSDPSVLPRLESFFLEDSFINVHIG